ncbi:uncharacterized protein EDB93DRAFT_1247607 [Suillus bovinus]|uniref:uncharacterized protein n=1 Tax=Suillus bovinus TaxID=48563 RepID=UPI001B85C91D|nr:uncharacterized protein EDB93DRAFT_1247607 [Suillus bovinus]KAG2155965.1 hypothetical protein EDB93DRAFT_1247607 [Suillus bovinus]
MALNRLSKADELHGKMRAKIKGDLHWKSDSAYRRGLSADPLIRIKIRTPPPRHYKCCHKSLSYLSPRTWYVSPCTMGVSIETIIPGDGKSFPRKGDTVTIHYVGTLENGTVFDSSRDRQASHLLSMIIADNHHPHSKDPFVTQIGIGKVIKGWDEGVLQLSLGQKANLIATPDYAYGSRGFPPVIPPNSTLKFEVELLKIN